MFIRQSIASENEGRGNLMTRYSAVASLALMIACTGLVFVAAPSNADAGLLRARTAAAADTRIVTAGSQTVMGDPSCCEPVKPCCDRCISYCHHRACKKVCCGCEPPMHTVLQVKDPCCCCMVDVPVCLPSCCTGCPDVCGRCGIFGRGVVTYNWCCGYTIKIVFSRCGDITVHYFGS
jgi:hypothetical protein